MIELCENTKQKFRDFLCYKKRSAKGVHDEL